MNLRKEKRPRLICDTQERLDIAYETLRDSALIATDVETFPYKKKQKGSDPHYAVMTLVSYSCMKASFALPFMNSTSPIHGIQPNIEDILTAVKRINDLDVPHVGHNLTYDAQWFIRYDCPLRRWAYDTMVMFWARYPELPKRLGFVASILLDDHQFWKDGLKNQDFMAFMDYGMDDTERTFEICLVMLGWLIEHEWIRENFTQAMLRCYAATAMNAYGALVDEEFLANMRIELEDKASTAKEKLRFILDDPEFNPNSVPQKKDVFYKLLGLPWRNAKGREVKQYSKASTGAVVMRLGKQAGVLQSRILTGIEQTIAPQKQISNLCEMPQFPLRSGNRRFLTSFDGVGTISTRLASRGSAFGHGSNVQNWQKKYRGFVKADPDCFFIELDFSGADGVFVAYESEDQNMIDVFSSGRDFHANTASLLFKHWTYDAIIEGKEKKDPRVVHHITGIRPIGKRVSHGANYIMAAYTLLMSATVPTIIAAAKEEGYLDSHLWSLARLTEYCEVLENRYRAGFPRLHRTGEDSWYTDIKKMLRDFGKLTTIYGFTLPMLGDPNDDATLRVGAAIFGQANTAGRVNAALNELVHGVRTLRFRDGPAPDAEEPALRISNAEHGIRPIFQVHDSLVFQGNTKHAGLHEGLDRIFRVMNREFLCKGRKFALGIEADVSINWSHNAKIVTSANDTIRWVKENFHV